MRANLLAGAIASKAKLNASVLEAGAYVHGVRYDPG
jgi:hypothetical protein